MRGVKTVAIRHKNYIGHRTEFTSITISAFIINTFVEQFKFVIN